MYYFVSLLITKKTIWNSSKKSVWLNRFRGGYRLYCECLFSQERYIDTLLGSRSQVSRTDVRRYTVSMLQNKSDNEPMVTKKKSKIPCLSLSSFLPALEGTVPLCWPLFVASALPLAFTRLVATFLGQVSCNAFVLSASDLCSVRSNTCKWCTKHCCCCCSIIQPVFFSSWQIFLFIDNNKFLFVSDTSWLLTIGFKYVTI